jgi:hypothetical protein
VFGSSAGEDDALRRTPRCRHPTEEIVAEAKLPSCAAVLNCYKNVAWARIYWRLGVNRSASQGIIITLVEAMDFLAVEAPIY